MKGIFKMEQSLIVRGTPQEYLCEIGSWELLEGQLLCRNIHRVFILHGTESWQAAKPYFPTFQKVTAVFENYGGVCTDQRVQELEAQVLDNHLEAIVAVRGGKVADLGKALAHKMALPVIILPTLAATCAPCTPLSVMYREDGAMERYDVFPQANALVLVEPRVLLHSPRSLMVAGIGDTLAKWYEADAIISQLDVQVLPIQVSHFAAEKCRDILLNESINALKAMEEQQLNQSFIDVIETNLIIGGMVGGFGDDYGRTAGAHSIHDALTLLPASHRQLHGNKVAYGVFVQLAIEEKWQEIAELIPFYHQLGLPISLKEMDMDLTEAEYQEVAERACIEGETIHYMKQKITPEIVKTAMQDLEKYTATK
ncbi:iron-containing alcohol dehydrogenase family protein [Enterococcus faecalis]|uniref:iron-containing alcohol dehydrogenase family protein n=1 Tax=Enterococcus faecalis TaxID=1351 RepID=UPI00046C74E9|nr:iron-containing alcohol dehydrogenase family protein [Enterococcus faecalis]